MTEYDSPLRRFASSPLSCGRWDAACGPAKPVPRLVLVLDLLGPMEV